MQWLFLSPFCSQIFFISLCCPGQSHFNLFRVFASLFLLPFCFSGIFKMWISSFFYPIPKPSIQSEFLYGTQTSDIWVPLKFQYAIRNNFSTHLVCFSALKTITINLWIMSRTSFSQAMVSFTTCKVLDNLLRTPFQLPSSLMVAGDTSRTDNTTHTSTMGNKLLLCKASHELIFSKG